MAVKQFAVPKNVKAVQSFFGLTGFFRKFVRDYAIIARPLTNLLKNDATFKWESKEYAAIENLKRALCEEPVSRICCIGASTELHTDAQRTDSVPHCCRRTAEYAPHILLEQKDESK